MNDMGEKVYLNREIVKRIMGLCDRTVSLTCQSLYENLDNRKAKSKMLGYEVVELEEDLVLIKNKETAVLCSKNQISLPEKAEWLFTGLELKRLDLAGADTSEVKSMRGLFGDKRQEKCWIDTIDLSGCDTSNVENMAMMFRNCHVSELNIQGLCTAKVTDMHMMFMGCTAQKLDVSSFRTEHVKNMRCMFAGCTCKEINSSSFDMSNVKDKAYMF